MAPLGQGLFGGLLFGLCKGLFKPGEGFSLQEVNPQGLRQPLGFGSGARGSGFVGHGQKMEKPVDSVKSLRVAKGQGLWHVSPILVRCCSSVVEHSIGNGEVDSSILSSSTIFQSGKSASPKFPLNQALLPRPVVFRRLKASRPNSPLGAPRLGFQAHIG